MYIVLITPIHNHYESIFLVVRCVIVFTLFSGVRESLWALCCRVLNLLIHSVVREGRGSHHCHFNIYILNCASFTRLCIHFLVSHTENKSILTLSYITQANNKTFSEKNDAIVSVIVI